MGLTIHYQFQLRSKSTERVQTLLEKLRQKSLDLPFEKVDSAVTHLTPEICSQGLEFYRGPTGIQDQPAATQRLFWLLECCTCHSLALPWAKKRELTATVDPSEAFAFHTWPGPGCESATFGLACYPKEIEAVYRPEDDDKFNTIRKEGNTTSCEFEYKKWLRYVQRLYENTSSANHDQLPSPIDYSVESKRMVPTKLGGRWHFSAFCKTQYASDPSCGGIGNFLRCHLSVIRMLEYAQELGIDVMIDDEGHFGPARYSDDHQEARAAGREPTYVDHPATHSVSTLVNECSDYNRMIAGMYGALKDSLKSQGAELQSPISQYANFEHLEADFHVEYGNKFDELIKSLGDIAKEEVKEAEKRAKKAE